MTGQELITHLRESKLDDNTPPYLWSDAELLRFLNYAEVQSCRRAHLLIDSTTANDSGTAGTAGTLGQKPLCLLNLIPDQATYTLSPKILQVKRCQLKSMTYPLIGPVSYHELDERQSGWWGTAGTVISSGSGTASTTTWSAGTSSTGGTHATAGTTITYRNNGVPVYFANEPPNTITFILAPSLSEPAYLVISRIPLISFTTTTSPEIEEKYHEGLTNWAAHLAFKKPDSDTINLNLSKMYEQDFTAEFGPLPDAYSERMRKTLSQKGRMRPREFGS
jgi:hypothetical protein